MPTLEKPGCTTVVQRVMIARQPITNPRLGIYGYELLFRASGPGQVGIRPTEATAAILSSTLLDVGLDSLVLDRKAVINVTRAYLDVITEIQLNPEQVILDLPTNIPIDDDLVARLMKLRALGYGLSVGGWRA